MIPDITGHKYDDQNEDGYTIPMLLALHNTKVP